MTMITPAASGPEPFTGSLDRAASLGDNGSKAPPSGGASAAVDRMASGAHEAVDRIASAASSAASHLNVKAEDLMAAKERWTQTCSTYVKDNPFIALGIAAAAGFLLSRLVR